MSPQLLPNATSTADNPPSALPSNPTAPLRRATFPSVDNPPLKSLLLFAHPDDETLALGARLAFFATAHLVHVTDGAPRNGDDARTHHLTLDAYRATRRRELTAALTLAGIPGLRRSSLDIPDQEAALHLVNLTLRVRDLLRRDRPTVLFTHPYEGGHPDHDATAFAATTACTLLAAAGDPIPTLLEPTFYHAGPAGIETGCFLPPPSAQPTPAELTYALTATEQAGKRALLACFTTQADTLAYFPLTYETFRLAPIYDFLQPPHPGPTFYDRFSWGMTSARFCSLAADALAALQVSLPANASANVPASISEPPACR